MNNVGFWPVTNKNLPILNVGFQNFWDSDEVIWEHYFSTSHCFLWEKYDVRYNPEEADVIFSSIFRRTPEKQTPPNRPKILLIHEPHEVEKNLSYDQFKAVISFTENSSQPNNIRIPYWVYRLFDQYASNAYDIDAEFDTFLFQNFERHRNPKMIWSREKFCGFVAGKSVPWRDEVIGWLNEYRQVDCGGSLLFNLPDGPEKDLMAKRVKGREANRQKADFFGERTFAIAMENTFDMPGYTTEKIIDAYYPGSIPIYAGQMNPDDGFNKGAFVNLYDHDTRDSFMTEIIRLNEDTEAQKLMRSEALFLKFPDRYRLDALLETYAKLFER